MEGGDESRLTGDPRLSSLPTLSQLPHETVGAGATNLFHPEQWWPEKFMESSFQLFPVFVGPLPLRGYEWTQGAEGVASVAADTFMRPKYCWVTRVGQQGRKGDKFSCS